MLQNSVAAPVRPRSKRRTAALAGVAVLALMMTGPVLAQQPAPAPAQPTPPRPAQPAQPTPPRPAQPAQPTPPRPAQPAQPGQPPRPGTPPAATAPTPAAPQTVDPPLNAFVVDGWQKVCGNDQSINKQVCLIATASRLETGQPIVSMALYDIGPGERRFLRVSAPLSVMLIPGVRITVDGQPVGGGRYVQCALPGCLAEVEASPDVVNRLRAGQLVRIQAVNERGQVVGFPLPLTDFAKIMDGPAMDPQEIQQRQQRMQEELERRGREMQERLQQGGGGTPGAAPPAQPPRQ